LSLITAENNTGRLTRWITRYMERREAFAASADPPSESAG
jgi:hypothetical protein